MENSHPILAALGVVPALQRPVIVPYLIIAGSIFGLVLIMAASKNRGPAWNKAAMVLISGLFIGDVVLMSLYVKSQDFTRIEPVTIVGRTELGKVGVNFQNPRIFPYRSFYDVFDYHPENSYLINIPMNVPGIYFRYNNMLRNFYWTNNYMPRHVSYANWQQDRLMWYYIHAQQSQIFFAPYAVETTDFNFQKIIEGGLSKDVVMIEPGKDALLSHVPAVNARRDPTPSLTSWSFTLKDCKHRTGKDLSVFQCKLPTDFPKYMASTFLTTDSASLTLPGFSPVQGQVVLPYTFDVNNVRDGWIVIGVPPEDPGTAHLTLSYPLSLTPGITKIFKNQSDVLGFNFKADTSGWMVFQYPYDVKWHLRVDGKETQLRRANKSFLAAPLSAGEHTVELIYWPESPLRWIIIASVLLAFIDLIVVLYLTFRRST